MFYAKTIGEAKTKYLMKSPGIKNMIIQDAFIKKISLKTL